MAKWRIKTRMEDLSLEDRDKCREDFKMMLIVDFEKKWNTSYLIASKFFWTKKQLCRDLLQEDSKFFHRKNGHKNWHEKENTSYWEEVKKKMKISEKELYRLVNKEGYTLTEIFNAKRKKWELIIKLNHNIIPNYY